MTSINIQFHGMPSEIIDFADTCINEHELNSVIVQLFPDFKAISVDDASIISNINKLNRVDQIYFWKYKPNISIKEYMNFLNNNPNFLMLSIGKYNDESLTESALSGQTDNPELLKLWKKIAKKLKSITLTGAWVVNPNSGIKQYYKNHRYTIAAKTAFEDGLKILPSGGWNYYLLKSDN